MKVIPLRFGREKGHRWPRFLVLLPIFLLVGSAFGSALLRLIQDPLRDRLGAATVPPAVTASVQTFTQQMMGGGATHLEVAPYGRGERVVYVIHGNTPDGNYYYRVKSRGEILSISRESEQPAPPLHDTQLSGEEGVALTRRVLCALGFEPVSFHSKLYQFDTLHFWNIDVTCRTVEAGSRSVRVSFDAKHGYMTYFAPQVEKSGRKTKR